jgi:hypothetical protein
VSRCRFAFVAAERASHAVATLCRVIGTSVSGFYAWLRAIPATHARAEAEAALRGHIGRIFAARHGVYGLAPWEWRGEIRTHAAASMVIPSMLARASAGVR